MLEKANRMVLLVAMILFPGWPALAQAVDCTGIASVQVSHLVTHNNEYGGHLNDHVSGQIPPANHTQANKTLFSSTADWEEAYQALANQQPALQCNTSAAIGSEAARTLPWQFFSYRCTAADGQGVCTNSQTIQTNSVTYVMRVVPYENSQRWIVYTAYPTP